MSSSRAHDLARFAFCNQDTSFSVIWSQTSPPPQFCCISVYGIWDQCSLGATRTQPLVVSLIAYRADLSWLWWGIGRRKEMEQLRLGGGVDQLKDVINHHISVISWTWPSVSSSEANWLWAWYTHKQTHRPFDERHKRNRWPSAGRKRKTNSFGSRTTCPNTQVPPWSSSANYFLTSWQEMRFNLESCLTTICIMI